MFDFDSSKSLADYLKVLSNDKQKYNSYLKWKTNYCSELTHYKSFCLLCSKLNKEYKLESKRISLLDKWNVHNECYSDQNVTDFLSSWIIYN